MGSKVNDDRNDSTSQSAGKQAYSYAKVKNLGVRREWELGLLREAGSEAVNKVDVYPVVDGARRTTDLQRLILHQASMFGGVGLLIPVSFRGTG